MRVRAKVNLFHYENPKSISDQHQSRSQQGQSEAIENAVENIVIEFNEENRVDLPMSPQGGILAQDAQGFCQYKLINNAGRRI